MSLISSVGRRRGEVLKLRQKIAKNRCREESSAIVFFAPRFAIMRAPMKKPP
jgi:hypothetical protein